MDQATDWIDALAARDARLLAERRAFADHLAAIRASLPSRQYAARAARRESIAVMAMAAVAGMAAVAAIIVWGLR